MELVDKIHSKRDKTIKYIFKLKDGLITESSYINKDDGKDIICVACQTACSMGCKFCHTTDGLNVIQNRNIRSSEICDSVDYIYDDLSLGKQMLLVSFMGCGEPLLNYTQIVDCMRRLDHAYKVRFAIATMIPHSAWDGFFHMTRDIGNYGLNVKFHLSLHFTKDNLRKDWMPGALEILPSLDALQFYRDYTKNSVEIHYAMIEHVNDSVEDAEELSNLISYRQIPVKLLQYNTRPCLDYISSQGTRLRLFKECLTKNSVKHEYYVPPGLDVGASCGQFLLDYYLKYNAK